MNAQAGRPPVITDVARIAGVSVPTVSRVLTGAARVSDEKRARVMRAIEVLDFRPSAAARALSWGRTHLVGVVTGNTSLYGYAETIRGIEEGARSAGFAVTITVVESAEDDAVERAVASMLSQPIAGVVVLKFDRAGTAARRRVPDSVPVVSVSGARERGLHQAVLDESAAAREVVDHLLDLGHQTVHHVRVPAFGREDRRTTGWRKALAARGREIPAVLDATWQPESGRRLGRELARRGDVTAVMCGNDEIAMGLIRGVQDAGLRVPEDISVIGFDDHPLAAHWTPALTTVRQDFCDLGGRSFGILKRVMDGDLTPVYSSARPTLVLRDSTAAPPSPATGPGARRKA